MPFLRLLLALACIAFGIAFVALNGGAVRLDLLWIEFELPLGLLLLSTLLLGALAGGLAMVLSGLLARLRPTAGDDEAREG
ncbi:lipopolysaccharide assembly protein LapA domain-containing protein [Silanimonas lenta]|uniref:lipopolysaccharide assembly protein LapA domain-containing protein n=1 Tax=Silanimonas lenta TaxID=265429 RepID=UPI0004266303|nr:lipopolysaccharide assembly protein LapA domain-containing protein [Silanimonas lenta]